jgi:hypothetical protein
MTDQELYAAIYDQTQSRMQRAGLSIPDKEDTLLLAECPPCIADGTELAAEPDNIRFLHKAFLLLLRRPIDLNTLEVLRAQTEQPVDDFRTGVITGIKSSEEFVLSRCILRNNPYTDSTPCSAIPVSGRFSSVTLPERLLRIYRKMPAPMKKAAKKILGAT